MGREQMDVSLDPFARLETRLAGGSNAGNLELGTRVPVEFGGSCHDKEEERKDKKRNIGKRASF